LDFLRSHQSWTHFLNWLGATSVPVAQLKVSRHSFTMFLAIKSSISLSPYPRDLNISLVCSPRRGAGIRFASKEMSENFKGEPICLISPAEGCLTLKPSFETGSGDGTRPLRAYSPGLRRCSIRQLFHPLVPGLGQKSLPEERVHFTGSFIYIR